jgi:hypothetical protein
LPGSSNHFAPPSDPLRLISCGSGSRPSSWIRTFHPFWLGIAKHHTLRPPNYHHLLPSRSSHLIDIYILVFRLPPMSPPHQASVERRTVARFSYSTVQRYGSCGVVSDRPYPHLASQRYLSLRLASDSLALGLASWMERFQTLIRRQRRPWRKPVKTTSEDNIERRLRQENDVEVKSGKFDLLCAVWDIH